MSISWPTAALATLFLALHLAPTYAQPAKSDSDATAEISTASTRSSTPPVPSPGGTSLLTGKITNAAGVLPGAVIILTGSKQMAVTNANGEFELKVPTNSGPLQARVTYAGYADELVMLNAGESASTVSLTNAKIITVARRQRLKAYLKTAHKQVRRDLKKVHSR